MLGREGLLELLQPCIVSGDLVAAYEVGLRDGTALSDWDLALVGVSAESARKIKERIHHPEVDVRWTGDRQEFLAAYPSLPYARCELLLGQSVGPPPSLPPHAGLVKLSSLFFYGFLRNYYELLALPVPPPERTLKQLNDFEYVPLWAHDLADLVSPLLTKVREARKRYSDVSSAELKGMLTEAVEVSWALIAELNVRLKDGFAVRYPSYVFLGREPTLFAPATPKDCRVLSEQLPPKFKFLYLPLGFQYIFSGDAFVRGYVPKNLGARGPFWKRVLKVGYALWRHLLLRHRDIYRTFSAAEGYSVKQARVTYTGSYELMPAEAACVERLGLPKTASILDVGCSAGRTTVALLERGFSHVTGVDIDAGLIQSAKAARGGMYRDRFVVSDVLDLPKLFPSESVDLVLFSYNGLDYLYPERERVRALEAIRRVLKPGGYFVYSSHNRLCLNRDYVKIFFKNIPALVSGRPYLLAEQSFGWLLTYFGTPGGERRGLAAAGFDHVATEPNVRTLFPFRDPFPYYIFRKR